MSGKLKCPACGSTAVYMKVSIVAKSKLNGKLIYHYEPWNVDNCFEGDCGCEKCGWTGILDEIYKASE